MNFALDAETQMLKESVSRFVADRAGPVANAGGHWGDFTKLGWIGLSFPEALGGSGLGSVGTMVLMEGLAARLISTPYLPAVVMAGGVLGRCRDAAAHLQQLIGGEFRATPGFFAAGANDPIDPSQVRAYALRGGYGLIGSNACVLAETDETNAILISAIIVGSNDVGLFLVDPASLGVSSERYPLLDGRSASHMTLNNVVVSSACRIDGGVDVRQILSAVRDEVLVAAAAENLGAMQVLYDQTLEYARLRKQFGRQIGSFQALQFRLVDMWIKLDEARSLVMAAAAAITDDRTDQSALAAAAWIQALWSGRMMVEESIQIHGAIGMTEECTISRYVKRILVNELLFGPPEHHLARYRLLQPV
ncbi:alkylation response protein AidB-like acyl-CoA dehydrogenase [Bradyrhizobium sp. USDA 3240]